MSERLYHLVAFQKDGTKVYCTSYPMPHDRCITMRSKFSNPYDILLDDVESPIESMPPEYSIKVHKMKVKNSSIPQKITTGCCKVTSRGIECNPGVTND